MVDDVAELLCWTYFHHPSVGVGDSLDGCGSSVPEAAPGAGGQAHRYARHDAPAERTARAAEEHRWDARSSFRGAFRRRGDGCRCSQRVRRIGHEMRKNINERKRNETEKVLKPSPHHMLVGSTGAPSIRRWPPTPRTEGSVELP